MTFHKKRLAPLRYLSFGIMGLCLGLCACMGPERSGFEVGHAGAIKHFMHQGDISAQADLLDFSGRPHFYALGALEGLQGEILVQNSRPIISYADEDRVRTDTSFNHRAALLVYAFVPGWEEWPLPDSVRTVAQLEGFLQAFLSRRGFASDQVVPFRLEGPVQQLDWHVIRWPSGDSVHTHAKHRRHSLRGRLSAQPVSILGFYATQHQGIFTHKNRFLHMHVSDRAGRVAGHVEDGILRDGMRLFIPSSRGGKRAY